MSDLPKRLRDLADKFSEGWHDGIKIDATDIELLADAAAALAESEPVFCEYCGGNDEPEQEHCTDCTRPRRGPTWIKTSEQYPPEGVRVFWFNPHFNQVGYDTWMGGDYLFAAKYWMHIPGIGGKE